ncbi:hypothetical protein PGT21_017475 [Puccinia graminis f. sp. tritici]|uniref:Uncharacterized protein n=1 Tax=Puccinia graminis f. sp. tritici TaxID=56615 RepID=A0A5B0QIS0_PUCGR|nr:hypothetical protein PGT21_017475 [Puccinia graminis f. sp. tritici]
MEDPIEATGRGRKSESVEDLVGGIGNETGTGCLVYPLSTSCKPTLSTAAGALSQPRATPNPTQPLTVAKPLEPLPRGFAAKPDYPATLRQRSESHHTAQELDSTDKFTLGHHGGVTGTHLDQPLPNNG